MWVCFLSWRVMRDMCTSCRILHNPEVFDTCYWWMCFHQPCVSVHVGESTCMAYWWSASNEFLSRFYYVRVDSRSILVTCIMLQSMSWWIFYVEIPYSTWRRRALHFRAIIRFEWPWDQVMTDCCCLLQRLAFSESHHLSWDTFPANTMA